MKYTVIHATDHREGVRGGLSSPLVITGNVPMRFGEKVRYEGLNERLFLETIDLNPRIQGAYPQPLSFLFDSVPAKDRRYTPDFLVKFLPYGGMPAFSPMLTEVKTLKELKENWEYFRARFQVASKYCCEMGWRFRVVTDAYLSRPYSINARFLYRFAEIEHDPDLASHVKHNLYEGGRTTVNQFLDDHSTSVDGRMILIPVIWHLVANRQIQADLGQELNMNSLIWTYKNG